MVHTLKWFGSIYLQSVYKAEDNILHSAHSKRLSFYKVEGVWFIFSYFKHNLKHLVKKRTLFSIIVCNIKELSGWAWWLYPRVITYQARKDESKYDEYEPRKNISWWSNYAWSHYWYTCTIQLYIDLKKNWVSMLKMSVK